MADGWSFKVSKEANENVQKKNLNLAFDQQESPETVAKRQKKGLDTKFILCASWTKSLVNKKKMVLFVFFMI